MAVSLLNPTAFLCASSAYRPVSNIMINSGSQLGRPSAPPVASALVNPSQNASRLGSSLFQPLGTHQTGRLAPELRCTICSTKDEARRLAVQQTRESGAEHVFLEAPEGHIVLRGSEANKASTGLFCEAASSDERAFFGVRLGGHIHPQGASLLPSIEDMELVAAEAANRQESVTFETGGWLPNGDEAFMIIIARYRAGQVSLQLVDPANVLRAHSATETQQVLREMRVVEQSTNEALESGDEVQLVQQAYQEAAARNPIVDWYHNQVEYFMRRSFRRKLRNAIQAHNPTLSVTDDIIELLVDAAIEFTDLKTVQTFSSEYRGPHDQFEEEVRNRVEFLRRASVGEVTDMDLTQCFPTEETRQLWQRYQAQGWEVEFVHTNDWGEPVGVLGHVDQERKRIRMRLVLSGEHPVLVFAHEVDHLRQLELLEANRKSLEQEIRRIIVNSRVSKDELEGALASTGVERADLHAILLESHAMNQIPQDVVTLVIHFLMERDTTLREIDVYGDLAPDYPTIRGAAFDRMLLNPSVAREIVTRQYQAKFGLSPELVSAFYNTSLNDLFARIHSTTLTDLDRIRASAQDLPPIPWQSAAEVRESLPTLIRLKAERGIQPSYMGTEYMDGELLRRAEEDPTLIDELVSFISEPFIAPDPGRVAEFTSSTLHVDLDHSRFTRHLSDSIRLIGKWNEMTGEARGVDEMIAYVRNRRVNHYSNATYEILYVIKALSRTRHSEKVPRLIEALLASPWLYQIKSEEDFSNNLRDFRNFLEAIRTDDVAVLPDPAQLSLLFEEFYSHWAASARASGDYHQFNNMATASSVAWTAANYFLSADEESYARKFVRMRGDAERFMEDYQASRGRLFGRP